ncbi:hypothetical protein [Cohnella rhizosphaerae]|uniref:Uncharacterized protein n=1 Tax=Cohnella rhizosphaerae TaxID=1457232 RepID=A0A9X4QU15_9BACL|nr:hypothetical protein [Cohnella rhizosphaerae]MDG0809997.1 hypothetical protein [Cohnella rhizosphaerae]
MTARTTGTTIFSGGITDNDGRPKLAYAAVNQLMTELDRARYVGTWDTGDPNVAVQVFLNDGKPVVVAWKKVDHKDDPAVKPPTSAIGLPFAAAGAKVMDINGVELPATAGSAGLQLVVSGAPLYVTGGAGRVRLRIRCAACCRSRSRKRSPSWR